MLYAAANRFAAGYVAGLLGSYISRRAGAYGAKALAIGAAGAGFGVGRFMKNRRSRLAPRKAAFKPRKYGRRFRGKKSSARSRSNMRVGRKRSAAIAFASSKGGRMVRRRFSRSLGGASKEVTVGRKLVCSIGRARKIDRRTLKLGFTKRILRYQRMNPLNAATSTPGSFILSHKTSASDTVCPMFLFCLNNTVNTSVGTNGPGFQLTVSDPGNLVFNAIPTQNPDATITQNKWVVEQRSPYAVTAPTCRYILNGWYDIRLNCYGARAQPTMYDIMVISFNHGYLDPSESPSNAQEAEDRRALWHGLMQPFMSNPLLPQMFVRPKYRVYKRMRFVIQPSLTTEVDTTAANRLVRIFIRDGQMYDYAYHGDGFTGVGADDKLSTVQYVQQNSLVADYSDNPVPKARKYLLIRAMNTTRTADDSPNSTPSMDICIRKGEYLATN